MKNKKFHSEVKKKKKNQVNCKKINKQIVTDTRIEY